MAEVRIRGSKQQALLIATLGFFGGFAGVAIFGPLVPKFTALLQLTPVAAGLLAGIPNLTGSLLRIPFGAWVDSKGGRRPFSLLLLLTLIGVAGLLLTLHADYPLHMLGTYPLLLVLGMLIGSGIASFSVGIGQVSYWFPRSQQGGPLGTYAGLGNMAPGLSSWLLPVAVASLGMLSAYGIWFSLLLVIALIYFFAAHDAPWFQLRSQGVPAGKASELLAKYDQDLIPSGSASKGLKIAASVGATWALVAFYFLSFGGFLALTAWLPTFWHQSYGMPLTTAGLLTLTFSILASLIRVPGGILADRISIRYALGGNLLLMAIGGLIVAFTHTVALAVTGEIVTAFGMGLQNAVVFKLVPRYVPRAIGGASGWVGGLGAFGGFAIPPLMGWLAGSTGSYGSGFLVVVVLALAELAIVAWLGRWTRTAPLE